MFRVKCYWFQLHTGNYRFFSSLSHNYPSSGSFPRCFSLDVCIHHWNLPDNFLMRDWTSERANEQIMFSLANNTKHKKKVLYFHVWVWRLQSFRSTRLAMRLLQVVMFFPSTIYLLLLFFSFPNSFSVSLAFRFRLTPILVVITFMLCLLRNEI